MKTLLSTIIMSAISVNPAMALEQTPTIQPMQQYVFSYDFVNLQDPVLRQYQHLSQELNYQLVRSVQQSRQTHLQQIDSDMLQFEQTYGTALAQATLDK